jgi:hydrogenase maturation protease
VTAVDPVRAIADAVLYEGYILWPYRRSALKNQQRWTFGGVYPRDHSRGREDDPWTVRAELLVEGGADACIEVRARFLQVVRRDVSRRTPDGLEPVDELTIGGVRHLSWEEAVEREVALPKRPLGELERAVSVSISVKAGQEVEALGAGEGAIVRRWQQLQGALELHAVQLRDGIHRLTVTICNTTPWERGPRAAALKRTFCSTHAVVRADDGRFVSLTDPPPKLAADAAECSNEGLWPVLVGEDGERRTVLASPIILEDHPRIAPESPGDLFDGGEIDQMLVLNILSLTDEEKAEMRDSDPRAREILERTEALSEEELMRLHGAVREFGMARDG